MMRRVSRGARLAIVAALVTSVLCVVAFARLAAIPTVANPLSPSVNDSPRQLVVASPEGLLVVDSDGAYRITPSLSVQPIQWVRGLRIDEIRSVAYHDGTVALLWHGLRVEEGFADLPGSIDRDGVLVIHDSLASLTATATGQERLLALRAHDDRIEVFSIVGGGLVSRGTPSGSLASPNIHLDAVEGMHFVDGTPYLMVGERGAHWLVDLSGRIRPMPGGAATVWSASALRPPTSRGATPFIDAHGDGRPFVPGVSYHAFTVEEDGQLAALQLTHGLDEPGVLVTTHAGERLELRSARRRLQVASDKHVAWQPVASLALPTAFAAFPVGDRWIALDEGSRSAVLLDRAGARLSPTSAGATIAAVTGSAADQWMALISLLGLFMLGLPLLLARTARALRILDEHPPSAEEPDARGVFLGTLHLPPGAVLHTGARGEAALLGHCQLRSGGVSLELSSGPRRHDFARHAPLVDGDPVYVVGAVHCDQSGGPFRAAQRKRLVPAHGRYLIGRGTLADFARNLVARENALLCRVALLHLTLALTLLGCLALRPFV